MVHLPGLLLLNHTVMIDMVLGDTSWLVLREFADWRPATAFATLRIRVLA